jgi:hypothetical protein
MLPHGITCILSTTSVKITWTWRQVKDSDYKEALWLKPGAGLHLSTSRLSKINHASKFRRACQFFLRYKSNAVPLRNAFTPRWAHCIYGDTWRQIAICKGAYFSCWTQHHHLSLSQLKLNNNRRHLVPSYIILIFSSYSHTHKIFLTVHDNKNHHPVNETSVPHLLFGRTGAPALNLIPVISYRDKFLNCLFSYYQ